MPETQVIQKVLIRRYQIADLERLINVLVGRNFEDVVRNNYNRIDAIADIMTNSEKDGWRMELLDAIVTDFQDRLDPVAQQQEIPPLQALQNDIKVRFGRGTALQDPFESCFVRGDNPYVNRPQLREAFSKMTSPVGPRITVVNGAHGSGKSYSYRLPQFVADIQEYKQFKVIYRDLSQGDFGITPQQVVQTLLDEWHSQAVIPSKQSQNSSFATDLSIWLAAQAPADVTWWIVLDGIEKINNPEIVEFIQTLAGYIGSSSANLRLVLLSLGEKNKLVGDAGFAAIERNISPLTSQEVVDNFFKMLQQASPPPQPISDTDMSTQAEWALQQAHARAGDPAALTGLEKDLLIATQQLGWQM